MRVIFTIKFQVILTAVKSGGILKLRVVGIDNYLIGECRMPADKDYRGALLSVFRLLFSFSKL